MRRKKRPERIDSICKRFKNKSEWLLIRVSKMDKKTTTPLTGVLLAHDTNREAILQKSIHARGLILTRHSHERLPKGYALAL